MSKRSRILVVDDDRGMRHNVLRLLHKEGYDVYGAESGEDAIRQAKVHLPDLIILDVLRPGVDGVKAGRRIKQDAELTEAFIVHLLARCAPVEERLEGLEAGADGWIAQPIENGELVLLVRAFLRHKATLDELRASEKRYRALYADNPVPMWIYDCGTFVFLDVNAAAIRRFGYSRAEFLGMPLADLIAPGEREAFYPALRDVFAGAREECWPYLAKNGEVVEVESTEQEVTWNGRAARAVLLSDVTERNRIDRERQALLEKYEREFKSLKSVSEFRKEGGQRASGSRSEGFAPRLETFVQRYIRLVERGLEQKVYKVDHNLSRELERLAEELFELTVAPRDLVELHCAAMKRVVANPSASQAQGLLESGRLIIVELMGYVLAAYRNSFLKRAVTE